MRIAVLVLGSAVAALGVLHVPLVRNAIFPGEKCPRLGGAALEDARKAALKPLAGTSLSPPPEKAAVFGLAVGHDGRKAVAKWAGDRSISCVDVDGVALRCGRTDSVLGFGSDVFFRFDGDRLVGLDALGKIDADAGKAKFLAVRDTLTRTFGAPHDDQLENAGSLASRWRFKDLAVDLSAIHLADGARVRVQVRSLQ